MFVNLIGRRAVQLHLSCSDGAHTHADGAAYTLQGAMSVCDSDDAGPDRFESTIEAVERLRRALRDEHSLLTQYKMIAWGRVFTPVQVKAGWLVDCIQARRLDCLGNRTGLHSVDAGLCGVMVCKGGAL